MIILNFLRSLIIIAKYQLMSKFYESKGLYINKIIFRFIESILYPVGIIKSPVKDFGASLREAFKELGPIYIKLGQTISASPKLSGMQIAEQLKSLQDKLDPFEFKYVEHAIATSFGKGIYELFSEFEKTPIYAASISQVHRATTKEGKLVAVKILRPNIHKKYNNDIKMLTYFAYLIDKYFAKFQRLNLKEIINILRNVMHTELNLSLEAAAASELKRNCEHDEIVYIPKIYWRLTSKNILTSEWLNGDSIYSIINRNNTTNREEIATKIAIIFFNQAFRDGFFHGDLHPGNILIMDNDTIGLVDFGIMGRLQDTERLIIAEILYKFLIHDYISVAKLHVKAGYISQNSNLELFAQNCKISYEELMQADPSILSIGLLLQNLFKITEDFGMKTQPQLILLQKTMIVVEGIGRILLPDQNMWELAKPYVTKWAIKNLSIEAKVIRLFKNFIDKLDL